MKFQNVIPADEKLHGVIDSTDEISERGNVVPADGEFHGVIDLSDDILECGIHKWSALVVIDSFDGISECGTSRCTVKCHSERISLRHVVSANKTHPSVVLWIRLTSFENAISRKTLCNIGDTTHHFHLYF
jgi:hypothetical protein